MFGVLLKKFYVLVFFFVVYSFWSPLTFALGTAEWMNDLYSSKPETFLVDVTIPGTHNSGTFEMPYWAQLEPGQPMLFNVIKPIVRGWSRTQFRSLYQQLLDGVRYLDLRVAFDKDDNAQIVHGLTSIPLLTALTEISRFTAQHPREVVLVNCPLAFPYANSLDQFRLETKTNQLKGILRDHFGSALQEFSHGVRFSDFWDNGRSVMILQDYQSYWPNEYSLGTVKSILDSAAKTNDPTRFSNLQLIFTPPVDIGVFLNPKYAIFIPAGESSLSAFSRDLREATPSMIKEWSDLGYHLNILSTDFVNLLPFVQIILDLNQRRLSVPQ